MKINNSTVVVKRGDICSSKCDVIVSSDDSWISQGGGVSMAIARAGGILFVPRRENWFLQNWVM